MAQLRLCGLTCVYMYVYILYVVWFDLCIFVCVLCACVFQLEMAPALADHG